MHQPIKRTTGKDMAASSLASLVLINRLYDSLFPPSPMVFPVLIFSGCDSKRSLNSISRKSPIVTSMTYKYYISSQSHATRSTGLGETVPSGCNTNIIAPLSPPQSTSP
ncbi:hypothetical protein PCH_Pc12g09310 [Penicillium rubens Wisconsin 54-1255]|uniref:Uncharacterized protein n=1 Tax=Penicillium rubens (strain ATCC 28089 / DSM 1075 / NRRL 1951 / Wisconsin 54-1255) TaxID=500485 RepID=B6GZ91_PENRW|nr:hypothetical protein PCH_Pc12g09310 [Penicillium rubens Wisconsin 54-1255]